MRLKKLWSHPINEANGKETSTVYGRYAYIVASDPEFDVYFDNPEDRSNTTWALLIRF